MVMFGGFINYVRQSSAAGLSNLAQAGSNITGILIKGHSHGLL